MANGLRLTHWTGRNPGHSAIVVCISCWRAVALNDVLHFVHCRQNGLSCKGWGKCGGLLLPCFYDSIIGHTTSRLTVGSVGADSDGLNLRPRPPLLVVFLHSLATMLLDFASSLNSSYSALGLSLARHSRSVVVVGRFTAKLKPTRSHEVCVCVCYSVCVCVRLTTNQVLGAA